MSPNWAFFAMLPIFSQKFNNPSKASFWARNYKSQVWIPIILLLRVNWLNLFTLHIIPVKTLKPNTKYQKIKLSYHTSCQKDRLKNYSSIPCFAKRLKIVRISKKQICISSWFRIQMVTEFKIDSIIFGKSFCCFDFNRWCVSKAKPCIHSQRFKVYTTIAIPQLASLECWL